MRNHLLITLLIFCMGLDGPARAQPDGPAIAPAPGARTGQSATQLPDGRWLLVGGRQGDKAATPDASIVDLGGRHVTRLAGQLSQARSWHSATLTPDGTVLILGGVDAAGAVVTAVEQYDARSGRFAVVADPGLIARYGHTATVLASNRLFVSGGTDQHGHLVHEAEIVDLAAWRTERHNLRLDAARIHHVAALLPGSDVLLWGGVGDDRQPLAGGEIYKFDSQRLDALGTAQLAEWSKSLKDGDAPAIKASQPVAEDENVAPEQAIVVQFTQRMMMQSLHGGSVTLIGPHGVVPAKVTPLEYGLLLFVTPTQDLPPGSRYTLFINQAKSAGGKTMPLATLGFGTARLGNAIETASPEVAVAASTSEAPPAVAESAPSRQAVDAEQAAAGPEAWLPDARHFKGDWRAMRVAIAAQKLPPLRASDGETALAGQVLTLHGRALGQVTLTLGGQSTTSDSSGRFLLRQLTPGDAVPPPGGCGSCSADANQPAVPSGCAGDPVDCATGLFLHASTDLHIKDVVPIAVRRSYRSRDPASRAFGRGTNLSYDFFLIGDSSPWTYQELVLPDGGRIRYERTSAGTGYLDAVYAHASSATKYAGSTLQYKNSSCYWELKLKSGDTMCFPDSYMHATPRTAAAIALKDRYGNTVTIARDYNGNATRVTSPGGRYIQLEYDELDRVISASDNVGRTLSYSYDAQGRLEKATDALQAFETYTYDDAHNMLTVRDKRGNLMVENEYDANGRVSKQTYAGAKTNLFAYTLDAGNKVTRTEVTDERGFVKRMDFNASGNVTRITTALGLPEQQIVTIERDPGTGLVLSQTDAIGRKTAYGYDARGNLTSETALSGTLEAATVTKTYTSDYNKLATITDALGRKTTLTYDAQGNAIREQDASGRHIERSYNVAGQLTLLTDALGKSIQFEYAGLDLTRVTDPAGRSVRYFTDSVGRVGSATDALGNRTFFEFDAADRATRVRDASNKSVDTGFDAVGNPTSVTDAKGAQYRFAFDERHVATSSTDPSERVETYEYDGKHNRISKTDRKNQVTRYAYDALERLVKTTYADNSTIDIDYDGANRPTHFIDSENGTMTLQYSGRDQILRASSPKGTIDYTYFANGLRKTMTVLGQPTLSYTYDEGNRLTRIDQAAGPSNNHVAQNLSFSYDAAGRRARTTYLNGVTRNDRYDDAGNLSSIVFRHADDSVLGDLAYDYDLAGRRIAASGSLARVNLPDAVTNTTVDISNRLLVSGATNLDYDANGNLTGDGVYTYVWNARDQLVRIEGAGGAVVATFTYDALGRRQTKTTGGVGIGYVYDGRNVVQELEGIAVRASYIGGRTDEVFAQMRGAGAGANALTYLTDALGSTIRLVDAAGAKVVDYSYDPYGNTVADATVDNPFQYTGRENDGTGLYYYRARYYSPKLARFISIDPIGLNGGINPYAYVRGNPVKYADPSGLAPGDPYRTQHDAARAALNQYNMSSIMDNLDRTSNMRVVRIVKSLQ